MNCIMVRDDNGIYDIPGNAKIEDWDSVKAEAEHVEKIESLTGWGAYTAAYKVVNDCGEYTYFVEE